jgi:hypothetical protein
MMSASHSQFEEEVGLRGTALAVLVAASAVLTGTAWAMPLGHISMSSDDQAAQHVGYICNPCVRCYGTRHSCTRRYVRRYGVRPNAGYGPGYCGYGPNQQGCAPSYF